MGWFDTNAPSAGGAAPRRRFGDPVGGGLDAPAPDPVAADPLMPPPSSQTPPSGTQAFTEEQFRQLIGKDTLTSDELWALRDELAKHGVEVMTNAEGIHGKISFMRPDGRREIVDVIGGASAGGNRLQWLSDNGIYGAGPDGTAPGQLPPGFSMGTFTGGGQYPLSSVMAPGLLAPWTTPFQAPDVTDDPGYKFRLGEGTKAIERAAAAKGTLATGGTLKDLTNFAQGLASTEYGNAYNRKLGEYLNAYNIFNRNQDNIYGRLRDVAGIGQNAAAQQGSFGSGYAGRSSDLITGAGNARAAGAIGRGNTLGGVFTDVGAMWPDSWNAGNWFSGGAGGPGQSSWFTQGSSGT